MDDDETRGGESGKYGCEKTLPSPGVAAPWGVFTVTLDIKKQRAVR